MSGNVVPFRRLTPAQALEMIRWLAERSSCIGLSRHSRKRMRQRTVSWPQIRHTLREGAPAEGPYEDLFGNWVCRLEARVTGSRVAVVVRMREERYLVVVTVIAE